MRSRWTYNPGRVDGPSASASGKEVDWVYMYRNKHLPVTPKITKTHIVCRPRWRRIYYNIRYYYTIHIIHILCLYIYIVYLYVSIIRRIGSWLYMYYTSDSPNTIPLFFFFNNTFNENQYFFFIYINSQLYLNTYQFFQLPIFSYYIWKVL